MTSSSHFQWDKAVRGHLAMVGCGQHNGRKHGRDRLAGKEKLG